MELLLHRWWIPPGTPGTAEFMTASNEQLLSQYRATLNSYTDAGQAKPDMKAFSDHRDPGRERRYGHLPGVAVGDEFVGRGELAVLGLHSQMLQGINCGKDAPSGAFAICLSGGFAEAAILQGLVDEDDINNGNPAEVFWYTGARGQTGQQAPDNAALLANHQSGTPVRVFRAQLEQQQEPDGRVRPVWMYVYEGLYQVIEHRSVPSEDGPLVVQFRMQGVPGHSAVEEE